MPLWLIFVLWVVASPSALVGALVLFCVWLRKHPYNPQPLPLARWSAPPAHPRARHLYKVSPAPRSTARGMTGGVNSDDAV